MIIIGILAALLVGSVAAFYPMLALGIVGTVLVLWLLFWLLDRPVPLIALILVTIVLGEFGRIPPLSGSILLIDILVGFLFVTWILRVILLKEKITWTSFHILWATFLGIAFIGLVATPLIISRSTLLLDSLYWVRLVLYSSLIWIIPSAIKTQEGGKKLLQWIVYAGVALAVIGFTQLVVYPDISPLAKYGWDPHVGRLVSTFLDPNFLGGFFALALATLLSLGLTKKDKLSLVFAGIFLVAAVLTYSRSGYLAVGLVVVLFGLRYSWKILLITACLVLPLSLAIPRVQQRVLGGFSVDATSKDRIQSWKNAFDIIQHFPLLGVGYDNYFQAQKELQIFAGSTQSHAVAGSDSSIFNVEAMTGLLGFGFFLASFLVLARSCIAYLKSKKITDFHYIVASIILFGGPALLLHSFFVNSLFYPFIFFPLMLIIGLVFVGAEDSK